MIKKINTLIDKKVMSFFTIFLFLQPMLDMLLGLFSNFNIVSNLISIFKILFMFFCLYYVFIIKKKNIKYILLLIAYCILFLTINILFKSIDNIFIELKILSKNIFLPITLMFVMNLFSEKQFNIKNIYKILIIYLILIFIPNVLDLGLDSYSYAKLGSVGFFYSANAIGSIISILMPLFVCNLIFNKNKKNLILFLLVYSYILVTIGTKAPILCALIVIIYYIILFIVNSIRQKRKIRILLVLVFILIITLLSIKLFPLTPFYKNIIIHLKFLKINSIKDIFTFHNFDHFIFSARLTCFKYALEVFMNSSLMEKIFGIGYVINGELFKTSEMDFLVTFIHQGIAGFVILYYLYFKILILIFKNYFKEFKENFRNIARTSIIISLFISILCAFLVGHVLETPSVSIFVVTLLAIAYNDFKCKR